MGWRNLFSSCAVVSVFCSGRKQVLVLHTTDVLRVPYSCGVVLVFFGSGGKQFLVLRMYLVYNTVVRLRQLFCCGGKVNFVRIPYSHDHFSKIPRTFFVKKMIPYKTYVREDQLFLALYGSTTIQSQLFLKQYRELCLISKTILIGFLYFREIQDKGFLFLRNTLLLYSLSPYRQTE